MRNLAFLVFLLVSLSAFQVRSSINGTKLASNYGAVGADLGARINAACADLAGNPGNIQVDRVAGLTISTAVNCSGVGQVIHFINGGTITVNANVTVNGIEGLGYGAAYEIGHPAVIFKQGNGRNLASMITLANDASSLRNVEIDGNKANNPSAGVAVSVSKAGNLLENLYIHDAESHGVWVKSTTTSSNSAAVPQIRHVISVNNGGDGMRVQDALDAFVDTGSEFELNGGAGIKCINCGGTRIMHSDFAQNQAPGIWITGVTGQLLSRLLIITANQFGQNYQHDILIDGADGGGLTAYEETITGNVFWSGTHRTSGIYDAIHEKDSLSNTITGNHFNSTTNLYRYAIAIEDTSIGATFVDTWTGNTTGGTYGTGKYLGKAGATTIGPNDDGNLTLPGTMTTSSALASSFFLGDTTNAPGGFFYSGSNVQNLGYVADDASGDGGSSQFVFRKSRGTQASRVDVNNGDFTGQINWHAFSGGTEFATSSIASQVSDTFTTGQRPATSILFATNRSNGTPAIMAKFDHLQNVILNATGVILPQNATSGFTYIPVVNTGKPNGTPTVSTTGAVPFVYDTTNKKLCVYDGGWICTAALN